MIELIVTDLDETLLGHEKDISERNMEAIALAKAQGIRIVCATGRAYHSIQDTLKTLDLFGPDDVSISFNGGMIHRNSSNEVVALHTLDHEIAKWLFDFAKDYEVGILTFLENETIAYKISDNERAYIRNIAGVVETDDDSFSFANDQGILKIIYENEDIPYLEAMAESIPDFIKEHVEISYSANRYLEFNPKGVNKGEALKVVSELYGIPLSNILALGDNHNDISMLVEAGYSGAPNNAVDAIHLDVDYVSPYRFDEDAVSDIIEHFLK